MKKIVSAVLLFGFGLPGAAQVYSPVIQKAGQPDATSLKTLTEGIYRQAGATTARERAEAIWRFFLTDGRYVKPGFWYHIAGWAYEEPLGEVLDPVKLMNSYGFGLCYHIAPLLAAAWKAGGFEDARVWFLTGHTVAEVYYDGAYHYFDSDMMGYNPVGSGSIKKRPVASVHQIEQNGNIILGNLLAPRRVNPARVDPPWYPADVAADAIGGLAELFTTTADNHLYAFQREPEGHRMDFTLRRGERMIRYYHPEAKDAYYLPYRFDGRTYQEFPVEFARYHIRTADGPQSQKDKRRWGTGRIEYRPPNPTGASVTFPMPSPYVIIDAQFAMNANLAGEGDSVSAETSTDSGRTWIAAATLKGPHHGTWTFEPAVVVKSAHGRLTSVSGTYGYQLRLTGRVASVRDIVLTTRFQLNPRTLPELAPGHNEMVYRASRDVRTEIPVRADQFARFASIVKNAAYASGAGQGYVRNETQSAGAVAFELSNADGSEIVALDAGGRFLDLRDGLAPDKLTAEVRKVTPWPAAGAPGPKASLSWALHREGPYNLLWSYNPQPIWKDGKAMDRLLRWPEVDRHVGEIPPGTRRVWVRYEMQGIAIDDFRLALTKAAGTSSPLTITQEWLENGTKKSHTERIAAGVRDMRYGIDIPKGVAVAREALIIECPR
jgi:hypothetical protein